MYTQYGVYTLVHSRSVDPRKLCVGVKYYIVHMYSMPYYTYGSTATRGFSPMKIEKRALRFVALFASNSKLTWIHSTWSVASLVV